MSWADVTDAWFARVDESEDRDFYVQPRLVAHIDDATIRALTDFYSEEVATDADFLDLMSSWISHLPEDLALGRVSGLGMNAAELEANPRLNDWHVHDLNANPELPYDDSTFDFAAIAVSIQYLTRPVEVLESTRRVLRPDGRICIAMSHRLFPTKAIAAFRQLAPTDRIGFVSMVLERAGYSNVEFIDRSPPNADPLWLVVANA